MLKITSKSLVNLGDIPKQYTCNGTNINPDLEFLEIPEECKSLVLIFDDLNSADKNWLHWFLWNMDPAITEIPENSEPINAIVGVNDFGQIGYGGPCPPNKKHTYRFLLYALDTKLNLPRNATRYDVERLIPQYLIESASFFVSYEQS